jgi:hypothetical protein
MFGKILISKEPCKYVVYINGSIEVLFVEITGRNAAD